ncbi:MAG: hypothetical protein U0Q16_04560 [Bryobacteraceae bacterium]
MALSVAVGLAWLAAAVLTEQTIPLPEEQWRAGPEPGVRTIRFDAPKTEGQRHIRLVLPARAIPVLNGLRLERNSMGDFDVGDLLTRAKPNELAVTGEVKGAGLRVTPRVWVVRYEFSERNGDLVARIWIRNTLENTVNAFVALESESVKLESNETVPPGSVHRAELRGKGKRPRRFTVSVDKQEEAMEGGYRFELKVDE